MKVILLNGPARSGKDSLAHAFAAYANGRLVTSEVTKFAKPLKESAHRLFGFDLPHDAFEAVKDVPQDYLHGKTWRQVYIAVSELLFKPLFGADIFGRMLVDEIELLQKISKEDGEDPTDYFLVSDSGFAAEAQAVVDRFGAENVILVRLERDGYTFAGDSRGYIELPCLTLNLNLGTNLSHLDNCVKVLFANAEAL